MGARMELEIEVSSRQGYAVVAPRGEIDLATNFRLTEAIGELLVDGEIHLVIDLSGVAFIDSTGLGALIGGQRKTHGFKGSFCLVCNDEFLLKPFTITGLDKIFAIYPTLDEATSRPMVAGSLEEEDQRA
jgi:anti-sigma B factor antagonist